MLLLTVTVPPLPVGPVFDAALALIGNVANTEITKIAAIKIPIPFFLVSISYLLLFFTYEEVYKTFAKKFTEKCYACLVITQKHFTSAQIEAMLREVSVVVYKEKSSTFVKTKCVDIIFGALAGGMELKEVAAEYEVKFVVKEKV